MVLVMKVHDLIHHINDSANMSSSLLFAGMYMMDGFPTRNFQPFKKNVLSETFLICLTMLLMW